MYSYKNIVANETIIEHFKKAKRYEKIAHAYIILGESGSGKNLLAYSFAKSLQCENSTEEACHKCESCIQVETFNNPDIKKLYPEKETSIGVDDIRKQINNDIQIKPYRYKHKIYIIENAERMTQQAQNALLKTLEEPPKYAVILLLVNNVDNLLSTIISRCIVLKIRAINKQSIKNYLIKQKEIIETKADTAAMFSKGSIGIALKLALSDEFIDMKDKCIKQIMSLNAFNTNDILNFIKEIDEYKSNIKEYLDLILMWYRDVLILKASGNNELIIFRNEYDLLLNDVNRLTYNNINNNILAIEEAKIQLDSNVNYELTLEMMFTRIKENV